MGSVARRRRPSFILSALAAIFVLSGPGRAQIPANDPFFRYIDWGRIPKDSIERIEIIRGGGATSLWGDLAMGGVINIVTREPAPGERSLSVGYGSFNTLRADAAATVFSDEMLRVGLTADRDQSWLDAQAKAAP